eukprot:TRINITY_DN11920_c0_g2_i2.p1 TRINITY_DN11920_c0_g2~~TRINITY_DN11920_c0_g2_i2.p1  ORF type:complete len:157 (+),score=17.49 TRINITY_DN11920_c0_g2_i2:514-984(+)
MAFALRQNNFARRDALEVLPYPLRWDLAERFELVQVLGPEDPRTIDHHGNVFQLVNGPPQQPVPRSSAMYRTMAALDVSWHAPRLMKIQNVYPTIERPIDLVLNATMERIEKNWSPIMFVSDRVLRLSRLFQPHQVKTLLLIYMIKMKKDDRHDGI